MSTADKNFDKVVALAQEHIGEPVTAAAIFQRKGSFASLAWQAAGSRAGALDAWAGSKLAARDLPAQTLLAITASCLYAFEAKGGFSWKIKRRLLASPVGTFRAAAEEGSFNANLSVDFGEGSTAQLETMTSMANARNLDVVRAIVAASAETPAGA